MKRSDRRVIGVIGIILAVIGVTGTIPGGLTKSIPILTGSGAFVIIGVILIAIGFTD